MIAAAPRDVLNVTVETTPDDWTRYVASRADATGYHEWPWRQVFKRAFDHESIYLAVRREGELVGVLPLVLLDSWLFGRALISLPFLNYGGVIADDDRAAAALLEQAVALARTHRCRHVELRHSKQVFAALPCKRHKVAMLLTLQPPTALWESLDRKVRNQVRKAQKSGLTFQSGDGELLDSFYDVFARNMRDLGTPVFPRALFERVLTDVADTRAYIVRSGDTPIAAGITVAYRGTVENIWASSLREYRAQCPNMLLYWTMIEDAVRAGRQTFDFGRSTPGEGTYHFKKQWGATEAPFAWEYAFSSANGHELPSGSASSKVALATSMWKRLPLPVANAIGPAIARGCAFL